MTKIPDICRHLQKLDQYVENVFVPALIDGLLLLPVKSGGMGIVLFADIAQTECKNSRNITESLTKLHLEQSPESRINRDELAKLKYNIKKEKMQFNTEILQSLIIELSTNKIRLNKTNQEKGATACLSTLPLKEEGYNLPKQEFWDLVKMDMDGHYQAHQICAVTERNMILSTVYHVKRVALLDLDIISYAT